MRLLCGYQVCYIIMDRFVINRQSAVVMFQQFVNGHEVYDLRFRLYVCVCFKCAPDEHRVTKLHWVGFENRSLSIPPNCTEFSNTDAR